VLPLKPYGKVETAKGMNKDGENREERARLSKNRRNGTEPVMNLAIPPHKFVFT
jgi:hypothetical protein